MGLEISAFFAYVKILPKGYLKNDKVKSLDSKLLLATYIVVHCIML